VHLYETHLSVTDTEASQVFYTRVVGLKFAYRDPTGTSFSSGRASRGSRWWAYGVRARRTAAISTRRTSLSRCLSDLLKAGENLRNSGVLCHDFNGTETHEPSIIGWMPSAQLYFRDPDGHLLEFIALLDDIPDPTFTGPLSQWQSRPNKAMRETASSPMSS
jgi:lactoylglutathione lyase